MFLYLIPTDSPIVDLRAMLEKWHLSYLEIDAFGSQASVSQVTVDEIQYQLIAPTPNGGNPIDPRYCKKSQTWLEPDSTGVRIGWFTDSPPGPEQLRRAELVNGYSVQDESGREWTIPIARSPNGRETIPSDFKFDPATGQPIGQRKQSFDWLWELSGDVFDYFNNDDRDADPAYLPTVALKILQVNYRVGPRELNAFVEMGRPLVDDTRQSAIPLVLIDFDLAIEKQDSEDESKKNDSDPALDSSNSEPG